MQLGGGGFAMMTGFAVARAIGNSSGRRSAEALAQPRWMQISHGTLAVGNFGFYLHDWDGIHAWGWHGIHLATLTGPGQLSIEGRSTSGPVRWSLHSDWAELIFVLWACTLSPHHPQLAGAAWLPQEWLAKAMAHTAGNSSYPGPDAFRAIMAGLR